MDTVNEKLKQSQRPWLTHPNISQDEEEKEREIRESQAAKERETREMMHMEGAISEQESHGVVNPSFLSTTDDTTSH